MKTILFLIIQRRMFKSRWKKRWFMCSRIWSLLYMQENFIFFSHFPNNQHFFKIVVTTGCGSSSSENCTYFEVSGANDGPCVGKICKCSSNICQVRFSKYIQGCSLLILQYPIRKRILMIYKCSLLDKESCQSLFNLEISNSSEKLRSF